MGGGTKSPTTGQQEITTAHNRLGSVNPLMLLRAGTSSRVDQEAVDFLGLLFTHQTW
jgi:hypothetical protein